MDTLSSDPRLETGTSAAASRVESVDVLRGLLMVLMALGHSRHFYYSGAFDPLDLARTSPGLFFTRWITHFCAPGFFFLVGTGTALSLGRGKSRGDLARFLLTRGLWLILLELTVVRFAWTFFAGENTTVWLLVIWALGCSMIVLAGFVYFPPAVSAIAGIVLIAGHNLLDQVSGSSFGYFGGLWNLLHVSGGYVGDLHGQVIRAGYPLIPWPGVMLLGWVYGTALRTPRWLPESYRRRTTLAAGIAVTLGFLLLRAANGYGNPAPWSEQASPLYTLMSLLNTRKYPPSLHFLLMTLGPLLIVLALWDRPLGWLGRRLQVFGRVPLFFYLLHLPMVHLMGAVLFAVRFGTAEMWLAPWFRSDPGLGQPLWVVYAGWLGAILLLFPVCRWWAGLKRRRTWWISYL